MLKKTAILRIAVPILSVAMTLICLEIALQIVERAPTGNERAYLDYGDTWRKGGLGRGGFLKEGFDDRVIDGYGGHVRWTNNADGFRNNHEFEIPKPTGRFRILSLGDSFTGGYRVGQKDTFSFLMEKWLQDTQGLQGAEVMVSVIEGPATGLYYLTHFGIRYDPNLLFLGITLGNDIAQAYAGIHPEGEYRIRSDAPDVVIEKRTSYAPNRFLDHHIKDLTIPPECLKPTNLKSRSRQDNDPQKSSLKTVELISQSLKGRRSRRAPQTVASNWAAYEQPMLFDTNGLGMYLKSPPKEIEKAYEALFALLLTYRDFCKDRGIILVAAIFPQRYQVQAPDWDETVRVYSLKSSCFDLMRPNTRIAAFCRANGIDLIDPTHAMKQAYLSQGTSLYFPENDMHWNRNGHRAFFEAARPAMTSILIPARKIPSESPTKVDKR